MGQLQALQEELITILSVGSNLKESRFWKNGLPKRLQVYRNTIHGNAYDTLDSNYPLTKKQFTEDEWFDLSIEFFKKNPPSFWELNGCVTGFPKFLKKKKGKPFVSELADYELTDLQAFVHTGLVKKGLGHTNPTVLTKVFQHQILQWSIEKAPSTKPPLQKPEVLLFYRDSHHEGHIRRADPLTLLLLDHFSKPKAKLKDAEPKRKKLLPKNEVPLDLVLRDLVREDLILL